VNVFPVDFTVIPDMPYTINNIPSQSLDVYIPEGTGLMPCVVWIHGGAWLAGSKDGLAPEVENLLHQGYVIASINYRLSSEAIFPAQIHDCKAAVRFLKENAAKFLIDTSKIAVAGSSAGGHLAALVGTSAGVDTLEDMSLGYTRATSRVQAVINYYGPSDFLIMDNLPDSCKEPMAHLVPDSPESKLLGCTITECPDRVAFANPVTYITPDDPPFLILHGAIDCTVTPQSNILLAEELQNKSVPAELLIIPGVGHGGPEFYSSEINIKVLNFLGNILY